MRDGGRDGVGGGGREREDCSSFLDCSSATTTTTERERKGKYSEMTVWTSSDSDDKGRLGLVSNLQFLCV